jgi:hypothetical protein
MSLLNSYLLEGPTASLTLRRQALVERMAKTMLDNPESLQSENDAIRILTWKHYRPLDVVMLAEEARYLAKQTLIGEEMSKS